MGVLWKLTVCTSYFQIIFSSNLLLFIYLNSFSGAPPTDAGGVGPMHSYCCNKMDKKETVL